MSSNASGGVTCFPPRQDANFVIHYDDHTFHVHRSVLELHSAYFRTLMTTLPDSSSSSSASSTSSCAICTATSPPSPPSSASSGSSSTHATHAGSKRNQLEMTAMSDSDSGATGSHSHSTDTVSPSAAKRAKRCEHPHIAQCVHLPQQTELVDKKPVTAADFHLFLCHLYYPLHYAYPPYLPKTDIDIAADAPPPDQTFPSISSLDWFLSSTPLRLTDNGMHHMYCEPLLTFAHYLDCAQVLAQVEAVLLSMVDWCKENNCRAWLQVQCLWWLAYADRYHLMKWRKACLKVIAGSRHIAELAEYETASKEWSDALSTELEQVAAKAKGK